MRVLVLLACLVGVAVGYLPPHLCGCPPGTPVCASNFRTYPSACSLKCDYESPNLSVIFNGRCEDLYQQTAEYSPPQYSYPSYQQPPAWQSTGYPWNQAIQMPPVPLLRDAQEKDQENTNSVLRCTGGRCARCDGNNCSRCAGNRCARQCDGVNC